MKNSLKLMLAGAVLVLGMTGSAQATSLDVVRDANGTPVKTINNDCLRSNWTTDYDNCEGCAQPDALLTQTRSVFFAFGRSTLDKPAKQTLNSLAEMIKAKGDSVVNVRVAGFADQIGSATANEKLSKKRADNVRNYLVSKGVVAAQVVETRWFGDSVAATNCPAKLSKAQKVKCLQPDRRVDVEVDTAPTK